MSSNFFTRPVDVSKVRQLCWHHWLALIKFTNSKHANIMHFSIYSSLSSTRLFFFLVFPVVTEL
ncbi:hypothetical protein E2C01_082204 [Portunus trituberculatus]|uniref:Uncharacterized protein n=1 Tax=Portunus trituberculatus TaxID=210409 RepID=A0A5B7J493_PORTR|nr:hypothetical protein [Portunus trituberculatus]